MFDEDCEDRGGAVSFADLERQEADRFARLLAEVDDRLYTPVAPASVVAPTDLTEDDGVRRYYSEGYEANYEGVSDEEIRQWQQNSFSYLRVEGIGLKVRPADRSSLELSLKRDEEENNEHVFEELDGLPSQDVDLVICGRSIAPPSGYTFATPVEDYGSTEEYFAQHGILQEYFEYNDGEERNTDKSDALHGPLESQKEEVLTSMMDAIWPDIVHALRPLISDVLTAARDNNIPYKVDQIPAPPVNEYGEEGGGEFDFASDDGW